MSEIVAIPKAFFEYVAVFERPIIALWLNRAEMVQAVFDALLPWGMDVADVEGRNEGKPEDQGFALRLPSRNVTLFFGPAKFTFTHSAPSWTDAEEMTEMIKVARSAILGTSGASVRTQKATVALHIQPKTLDFREILSGFWPASVVALHDKAARTGAIILRWPDAGITIDGSGVIKNGVFLKLEREFSQEVTFESIAGTLRDDEEKALAMLNLEVEQA